MFAVDHLDQEVGQTDHLVEGEVLSTTHRRIICHWRMVRDILCLQLQGLFFENNFKMLSTVNTPISPLSRWLKKTKC